MDIANHCKSDTLYVFDICLEDSFTEKLLLSSPGTIETLLLMHMAEAY